MRCDATNPHELALLRRPDDGGTSLARVKANDDEPDAGVLFDLALVALPLLLLS